MTQLSKTSATRLDGLGLMMHTSSSMTCPFLAMALGLSIMHASSVCVVGRGANRQGSSSRSVLFTTRFGVGLMKQMSSSSSSMRATRVTGLAGARGRFLDSMRASTLSTPCSLQCTTSSQKSLNTGRDLANQSLSRTTSIAL